MTKLLAIILSVLIIAGSAAIFYFASTFEDSSVKNLKEYNARKEDIYLTMTHIEKLLNDLNQSIESQKANQVALTDKITELSIKADLPAPVINTTKYVQPAPIVVPKPKPTPTPITRAS